MGYLYVVFREIAIKSFAHFRKFLSYGSYIFFMIKHYHIQATIFLLCDLTLPLVPSMVAQKFII